MNLQDYIASKKAPKATKADIMERWQSRVVAAGLHTQGEAGAQVYLSRYGKSIAAPKVLALAFCAQAEGCPEFANAMFKKAAELEGVDVSDVGNPNHGSLNPIAQAIRNVQEANVRAVDHPGFPSNMQPGRFAPMQPSDAKCEREQYINDDRYWGQPKIDGEKLVIFATPDNIYYQSRQMKLNGMPDVQIDNALRNYARLWGNFILEGELTYLDCFGKEHMSGPQALEANQRAGYGNYVPEMKYYVFNCPWRENDDMSAYGDMVTRGREIAHALNYNCHSIMALPVAQLPRDKIDLVRRQENQGREGEVWFMPNMLYVPGKNTLDIFVRTKYYVEFPAICVGFTETTAAGHAFGAMCITDLQGNSLGNIGTGFTREDKRQLLDRFRKEGPFYVEIRSQRMSEYGQTRHGRFLRIVE